MIPLEIIAAVFERLAEQHAPVALQASALACRQFREVAQDQLFRVVDIPANDKGNHRAAGLVDILSTNPGLAKRIRELSLTLHPGDVERDKIVLMALNLMDTPKIGTISIHLLPMHQHRDFILKWTEIHEPLRAALERVMFSPALHTFRLQCNHFPLHHVVSQLKNVKSLALEDVISSEDHSSSDTKSEDTIEPLRLRELRLVSNPLCVTQFLTACHRSGVPLVDWSAMKSLAIDLQDSGKQDDVVTTVSDALAQTPALTTFHIRDVRASLDALFSKLHPQAYNTLRLIDVSISLDSMDVDPYLGLLDGLANFPSCNNLETLRLRIDVHFTETSGEWDVDEERWGKITEVLEQSAFPSLKDVEMDIYIYDHEGESSVDDFFELSFDSLKSQFEFSLNVTHEIL